MSMLVERETSAGSEGARRATVDPAGRDAAGVEDPEVVEQAKRRRFTAEYKLRIVREVLPPLSVGKMTLRLYAALNYSQNSARDLRRALNGA